MDSPPPPQQVPQAGLSAPPHPTPPPAVRLAWKSRDLLAASRASDRVTLGGSEPSGPRFLLLESEEVALGYLLWGFQP